MPARARRPPRTRKAASTSASSCSRSVPSILARRSPSVSNSLAARARSSSSGGSTFSCTSRTVISTVDVVPSASAKDTCFVSPAEAPSRAASSCAAMRPAPELDDRVALSLSVGVDEIDDERVAVPGGAAVGGRQLGDGLAQRLELGVHGFLRYLDLGARNLERRPVDDLESDWISTVAVKRHASSAVSGSSNSYSGSATGRTRLREAALQNQPPM